MKITRLRYFYVKPRWQVLAIDTDEGITGYSEAVLEGRVQTVRQALKEAEEYLVGRDPRPIERHWQHLYRSTFYRGGPILTSALSAVDMALWDILGKHLNAPVHVLLGGPVRDRVRLYRGIGGDTPEAMAKSAKAAVAAGFTMVKTSLPGPVPLVPGAAWVDRQVALVAALKEALGTSADFALDFHGRFTPAASLVTIGAIAEFRPLFIEEPVLPENVDALAEITRKSPIPIATGERLFTRWGFREPIERGLAHVYQPDLCHAGGISEGRRIAALAETYYAAIAPHNPLGPVALAAALQLDAAIPNFLAQEHADLGERYLVRPFVLEDGHLSLPSGPGLGVEVNEAALAEGANDGEWHNPTYEYPDGSLADW